MQSHLQFRLNKIGQAMFKTKKYEIRVNSTIIGNVNYLNPKLSQEFEAGKYVIEVFENEHYVRKDIILNAGQTQTITVNPNLSYLAATGFLMGLAVIMFIIKYLIVGKVSLTLIALPSILIFLLFRRKFGNSFDITIKKISI